MPIIFHIASKADWQAAKKVGQYAADSLATEGFIHCSTAPQVIATANRLFRGRRDLVLLCIASERVKAEIRYENLEGGAILFPHVYGVLESDAVVSVHDFRPLADGGFELPASFKA